MKDTNDRKWEILSTEYLIRRPWLTARRDHVKLPTGVAVSKNTTHYETPTTVQ